MLGEVLPLEELMVEEASPPVMVPPVIVKSAFLTKTLPEY